MLCKLNTTSLYCHRLLTSSTSNNILDSLDGDQLLDHRARCPTSTTAINLFLLEPPSEQEPSTKVLLPRSSKFATMQPNTRNRPTAVRNPSEIPSLQRNTCLQSGSTPVVLRSVRFYFLCSILPSSTAKLNGCFASVRYSFIYISETRIDFE